MSLFFKPKPVLALPAEEFFNMDDAPPRQKQSEEGGGTTVYKIMGVMIDGVFTKPGRYELYVEGHADGYRLGDDIELTQLEAQVIGKRAVLIPLEALSA